MGKIPHVHQTRLPYDRKRRLGSRSLSRAKEDPMATKIFERLELSVSDGQLGGEAIKLHVCGHGCDEGGEFGAGEILGSGG